MICSPINFPLLKTLNYLLQLPVFLSSNKSERIYLYRLIERNKSMEMRHMLQDLCCGYPLRTFFIITYIPQSPFTSMPHSALPWTMKINKMWRKRLRFCPKDEVPYYQIAFSEIGIPVSL
ncbi:hypothetical protein CDL12_16798 [Handroanthus impetiginosus]|uniref:Uncharacterized protein n=1 Tax=Handroanthus impetiginosus TaxID=429701 RepID=A0A2G9GZB0_9LAMI|nr:hypothetical protein CDL12_16798 [Handroanthus impetiginosus]